MEERDNRDQRGSEQLRFPELIDIETLARLLGVGERYVRRLVAERRVPTVKLGHLVRFDMSELRPWIEAQRRPMAESRRSPAVLRPDGR